MEPLSRPGSQTPFRLVDLPNGWTVGRFAALDRLPGVVHMVTTRKGPSVILARDDRAAASDQAAEVGGLSAAAWCNQVHGATVLAVDRAGLAGDADGLVTAAPGLALAAFSADCPLILAADPAGGAVGIAHASWRGTVGRIARELIRRMAELCPARPADIVACICPSAGPCCYEVGQDVVQAALAAIGKSAEHFFLTRKGKLYFDLWKANTAELLAAGLAPANVHACGVCTMCRNDLLPSYRREGAAAGRFLALIASGGARGRPGR